MPVDMAGVLLCVIGMDHMVMIAVLVAIVIVVMAVGCYGNSCCAHNLSACK